MKITPVACVSCSLLSVLTPVVEAKEKGSPNVILILVDDLGFSDIGCFGSEIETPNLNRLAGDGLCMSQYYNGGRSCPSRASLLTGLYPHQTGIGYMIKNMGVPAYQGYLNRECVTLPEVLKSGGYSTYMSGKWHVGEEPQNWPRQRGFDRYYGLISGASSYFHLNPDRQMAIDDTPYIPPKDSFYMTDAFTDRAIGFLKEHDSSKPFFLYLAYTAPHWPLQAPEEDIAKYRGTYKAGWEKLRAARFQKLQQAGILGPEAVLSDKYKTVADWDSLTEQKKEEQDLLMAIYAAMIDRLDQNIGRLMTQLKESGADENTLIVFLSDNGACQEDTHGRAKQYQAFGPAGSADSYVGYGYPWANASNSPFRLFKHYVHEGGISTPFIVWYPKRIKPQQINTTPAHIIDIMPTFVELSGCKYPKQYKGNKIKPMEGISLLPAWTGKTSVRKEPLFWEHEGNRALREGDWKLVSFIEGKEFQPWELYNLKSDRSETVNLANQYPDRVRAMEQTYQRMSDRIGVVPFPQLEIKK